MQNNEFAKKLYKPIIREFEKWKVHPSFTDNIWGPDLADIPLLSKFKKRDSFLLCAIDIYGKYAWVIPLKNKKSITIDNDFKKILVEPGHKANKIWVDKGSEFQNKSIKSWLEKNDIEMHSAHNEEKSVAEKFIRTLMNKIYKYMTSVSKNGYINKLDDIANIRCVTNEGRGGRSPLPFFKV